MYYYIGDFRAINSKEIIGVFDVDSTTISKRTRDYLKTCEKQGKLENISHENIPLSFVVSKSRIYFSPISTKTICLKRKESGGFVRNSLVKHGLSDRERWL